MYLFKADFSGVSLFVPFPDTIANPMLLVKWESCLWPVPRGLCHISRRLKYHQENKILGREYLKSITLLLSVAKCLFIWLGQGIFPRDVHNVFSVS